MSNLDLSIEHLKGEIEDLYKKIAEKESYLATINQFRARFPDLKRYVGRWKRDQLWAKSALPLCTDYEIRRTCGCCSDAGYCITPYVEINGVKIYGWHPMTELGEGDYDIFRVHNEWEDRIPSETPTELSEKIKSHVRDKEERARKAYEILYEDDD